MLAVFFATYAAVFAAEIVGDKLLYTTGVLATRFRTLPIVVGVTIAFMAKMGVAVAVGEAISRLPRWLGPSAPACGAGSRTTSRPGSSAWPASHCSWCSASSRCSRPCSRPTDERALGQAPRRGPVHRLARHRQPAGRHDLRRGLQHP